MATVNMELPLVTRQEFIDQIKRYVVGNMSEHLGKPITPELMDSISDHTTHSLINYIAGNFFDKDIAHVD